MQVAEKFVWKSDSIDRLSVFSDALEGPAPACSQRLSLGQKKRELGFGWECQWRLWTFWSTPLVLFEQGKCYLDIKIDFKIQRKKMESLAQFLACSSFLVGACTFWELGRYFLKPNKTQKKKFPIHAHPAPPHAFGEKGVGGYLSPTWAAPFVWLIGDQLMKETPAPQWLCRMALCPACAWVAPCGSDWLRAAVVSMFFSFLAPRSFSWRVSVDVGKWFWPPSNRLGLYQPKWGRHLISHPGNRLEALWYLLYN